MTRVEGTDLVIRRCEPRDADTIARFNAQMAFETEGKQLIPEVIAAGVRRLIDSPSLGFYIVAEHEGSAIACLMITNEWSDWRNGTVWWIHSLYFKPEVRGLKLFSGMYDYIRRLAETDPRVRGLRLYVDQSNSNAQAVYSKLGMNGEHYRVFEWMKKS